MYHANLIGGVVSYFARIKRIIWSLRHASLSFDDSKFTTRLVDRLSAIISYLVPDKIIAISNKVEEVHISRGYASRFTVIYNGCDTSIFSPDRGTNGALAEELGLKPGVPVIGCVARWTPEKDHATLLRAIAMAVREYEFQAILVGAGCVRENPDLSGMISDLGIQDHVILAGPRGDIPDVMNLLDVHILPSKNEAFGNVLIEAMSCGTPCISTNVGDAAHIIGDTGWIVDRQNPVMMSKSITSALSTMMNGEDGESRKRKSRSRVVDMFSLERMMSNYRMVWDGSDNMLAGEAV
jgi:glycosyltransferase involved in cell wall biosynthesis